MNKIEKGKATLNVFGLILLALGVLAVIGGVVLIIIGATADGVKWVSIVLGIILVLGGLVSLPFTITITWTSFALTATKGSYKEENLAKNTKLIHKCEKCGTELPENSNECPRCNKK